MSVDQGETVRFKVNTPASSYRLDIYRVGYYGGSGARKVATVTPSASLPQTQPACLTNAATGLVDCGNWAQSASWAVPGDAVSGVYFARLVRNDTGGASHVLFVVRDDDGSSDLLLQTADTTWQAYNTYGGNSLYLGSPAGRAYKVSYNRPIDTRGQRNYSFFFSAEYPLVRWIERNGYDVSYFTGVDTDRRGSELLEHDAFLSVGHDEYWSAAQRTNVENARAAGVHLGFFSGNEVFWKTRWESSIDGSGTAYRTLVSYKETHAGAKIDPTAAWTGTWRDPSFSPPADGGRPENALTGTLFMVNGYREDQLTVPAEYGGLRFWRNTSVASLAPGGLATFPAGTLGYEWDEDLDNGSRPPGLLRLSSTTINVPARLVDQGSTYAQGNATHSLALYRHASGALVFGAGTVQWGWGLDSEHDTFSATPPAAPDVRMQQATVNLLADMEAQPATLQSGLAAASLSTDTTGPASTITLPASGANVQADVPVTVSGTASDAGGVVAAVEISTDGGVTWHPVSGRTTWSYTWTPLATGPAVLKSRAIDDSANIGSPSTGVAVTVLNRPGLVGAWSFDEGAGATAADSSGSNNTATLSGAAWNASGRFGKAVSFDGVNDWVTVADSSSLDLTSGMTLEAWLRPSANGGWRTGLMKEAGSSFTWGAYANTSSNRPTGNAGPYEVEGAAQLPLNTWTHLAVTYDRVNLRLYVNGTQVGVQPATPALVASSGPFRMGGNSIWDEWYSGLIDEVRVYNRALTAPQVQSDLATAIGNVPPPQDTTAPSVAVTAPAAGSTVSASVSVSASASDDVGVAGVQFKLDGVNLGPEDTSAPYAVSWNTALAADGPHSLTATARDAAGNVATSSTVGVTVDNAPDTTAPTVSLTAPSNGATVSGAAVVTTATAADNKAVAGVQFRLDGISLGAEDINAPYSTIWDSRTAANGPHTLTAVARDQAGNTAISSPVGVVVDNDLSPPTVTMTAPAPGSTVSGTSVAVSADASDDRGVAGVQFRLDGTNIGAEDTSAPFSLAWNSTSTPNGPHQLNAVARDAAGNQNDRDARTVRCAERGADAAGPGGGVLVRRGVGGDRGGRLWDGQRRDDLGGDLERGRPVRVGAVVRRHERLGDGGGLELARPHEWNDTRGLGATDLRKQLANDRAERAWSRSLVRPVLELERESPGRVRGRVQHGRHGGAGAEYVDASRRHVRPRESTPVRQRRPGGRAADHGHDGGIDRIVPDRRQQRVGGVLRGPDRRGPCVQPGSDGDRGAERHEHAGRKRPAAAGYDRSHGRRDGTGRRRNALRAQRERGGRRERQRGGRRCAVQVGRREPGRRGHERPVFAGLEHVDSVERTASADGGGSRRGGQQRDKRSGGYFGR